LTSPFGKVVARAIGLAQREIHGGNSESRLEEVDIYAPGLGHNAIGAAHYLRHFSPYEAKVTSLTLPNLIGNLGNKAVLLARYSISAQYRDGGLTDLDSPTLRESVLSREADVKGSERAMRRRQLEAMITMLGSGQAGAMLDSSWIRRALAEILDDGVPVTVPLAHNARITQNTHTILPDEHPNLERLDIKSGVEGKKIDLISNEFVTLGSLLALSGAKRALELKRT
jgi:hypothetical protein